MRAIGNDVAHNLVGVRDSQARLDTFAQLQQCTAEIKVLGSYPAAFN